MLRISVTVLALLAAAPVLAGPNTQLLRQIESGLVGTGVRVDLSKLTSAQAVAISFALDSPEENGFGEIGQTKRDKVLAILRWNPETDPDR